MQTKNSSKRLISLLLVLVMALGMLPVTALAEQTAEDTLVLTVQPSDINCYDTEERVLKVAATASGTLSYQWYKNNKDSTEGGEEVLGGTGPTLTMTELVDKDETAYYYCVVTNTKEGSQTFTAASRAAKVVVKMDPTPVLTLTEANGAPIPGSGYEYAIGDTPVTILKVNPVSRVAGGTYSYVWKYSTAEDGVLTNAAGTRTAQTYTPPVTADSLRYYTCEVSYKVNGLTFKASSERVAVKVTASQAAALNITKQPVDGEYPLGSTVVNPLTITVANVTDGGTVSYQWQRSESLEGEFADISGASSTSCTPEIFNEEKTLYYRCHVTYELNSVSGTKYSAEAFSDVVSVRFSNLWEGLGTKASPFLIKTAEDMNKLRELVNDKGTKFTGIYFRMSADLTLPEGWVPVGSSAANCFSGNFDGGENLLTIPEDGLPLFGYVAGATISNLDIYGTRIAGFGLVNFYNNASSIVNIENVTLKSGTQTLKSGLIGGDASGMATVTIKNCTAEEGVVIGYNKTQSGIASFGGGLNGIVVNCVSYATVYGVDKVGGIVAYKAQSMGEFVVQDCAFHGDIVATGQYVGGIVGKGYSDATAPNSPCVSIRNCYATGNVAGTNYVGGIFGGEGGVIQAWANGIGYIQNNYFSGKVSATAANAVIGGVIGNMRSLDCYNVISNNYYADTCGAGTGIGRIELVITPEMTGSEGTGWSAVSYNGSIFGRGDDPAGEGAAALSKSITSGEIKDGTLTRLLNTGLNSSGDWVQLGENGPSFGGKRHILRITCPALSSSSGVNANVNGSDILAGKQLTLIYSDGTTETVDATLATRSNFIISDATVDKSMAASLIYNNQQLVFRLNVKAATSPNPSPNPSGNITVSFTLLGDDSHGEGGVSHTMKSGNLKTWISKTEITVAAGSNVMSVFSKILNQNGYSWMNDDKANSNTGNYIQSITTPGGVTLAEFTNGKKSGWMYTLNGKHPELGVKEQLLNDGDVIVFHYTDDYTQEEGSEKWGSNEGNTDTSKTLTPKVTVKDGVAAASISSTEMSTAIADAKKSESKTITIAPEVIGKAAKVTVELPKTAFSDVAAETNADLQIVTPVGSVTIPNEVLASVVSQASGSTVAVAVEAVEKKTLTEEQQKLVGDSAVFGISILSENKPITSFGGKNITIFLPYTLKTGETAEGVTIWYLGDSGKLERMTCKYDKATRLAAFTTTHLSHYVVGYDAWQNPFIDVKTGDWFYDSVRYTVENKLFNGTSATTFSPNADMTRAMLVTILYRLEGKPAVSGTNSFSDVKDGEWYTDAILWANGKKLVEGYGNGLFGTNDSITREQMAVILYRYAQMKGCSTAKTAALTKFTDAKSVSEWANSAIKWAVAEGLISGTTATTLEPRGTAARAQAATILMRFLESKN